MNEPTQVKVCTGCKTPKPLTEFGKDRGKKDGLTCRCKPCKKVDDRAYAVTPAGRESQRRRSKKFMQANADRHAAWVKAWREAHPGYSAESNRKWREANPDRSAEWYQANREKVRENYLRRRALIREVTVGEVDIEALWVANDGTCQLCGEPIDRTLRGPHPLAASIDHIVPLAKGGTHEQANLQWAHLVCNKRKGAKAL